MRTESFCLNRKICVFIKKPRRTLYWKLSLENTGNSKWSLGCKGDSWPCTPIVILWNGVFSLTHLR